MNAEAAPRLPYNGRILEWAREWRGKSLEEAAKKLQTKTENIVAWERGDGAPSVRQARILAEFYERSFLEFFLDEPPKLKESELLPDYRIHKGGKPEDNRELWHIQQWAETQRVNALALFEMIGIEPPVFPRALAATLDSSPERIAIEARRLSEFSIWQQLQLTGNNKKLLPALVRNAFEKLGALVLRRTDLGQHDVRGLTIAQFPLPTIVFGAEAATAQAFTLAHEFGHICLQKSGISGPPSAKDASTPEKAVERWCDEFAGAFLVPADAMATRWAKPNEPIKKIGDSALADLATAFRISRHAMLIRLVHLGYVDSDYYWNVKRPEFLKEEARYKAKGWKPPYYGKRYLNTLGNLYTGLVLEAWNRDVITNDKAAQFMGIKNLMHLEDIGREFRA